MQVLVDAECTHDGSVKHIQKFENWGWITLQRRVLDAERTDNLHALQVKTRYSRVLIHKCIFSTIEHLTGIIVCISSLYHTHSDTKLQLRTIRTDW